MPFNRDTFNEHLDETRRIRNIDLRALCAQDKPDGMDADAIKMHEKCLVKIIKKGGPETLFGIHGAIRENPHIFTYCAYPVLNAVLKKMETLEGIEVLAQEDQQIFNIWKNALEEKVMANDLRNPREIVARLTDDEKTKVIDRIKKIQSLIEALKKQGKEALFNQLKQEKFIPASAQLLPPWRITLYQHRRTFVGLFVGALLVALAFTPAGPVIAGVFALQAFFTWLAGLGAFKILVGCALFLSGQVISRLEGFFWLIGMGLKLTSKIGWSIDVFLSICFDTCDGKYSSWIEKLIAGFILLVTGLPLLIVEAVTFCIALIGDKVFRKIGAAYAMSLYDADIPGWEMAAPNSKFPQKGFKDEYGDWYPLPGRSYAGWVKHYPLAQIARNAGASYVVRIGLRQMAEEVTSCTQNVEDYTAAEAEAAKLIRGQA